MFEYQFVECPAGFRGAEMSVDSIREVVERHSREGWRLVQVLVLNPPAIPNKYQVIFERPVKTN